MEPKILTRTGKNGRDYHWAIMRGDDGCSVVTMFGLAGTTGRRKTITMDDQTPAGVYIKAAIQTKIDKGYKVLNLPSADDGTPDPANEGFFPIESINENRRLKRTDMICRMPDGYFFRVPGIDPMFAIKYGQMDQAYLEWEATGSCGEPLNPQLTDVIFSG